MGKHTDRILELKSMNYLQHSENIFIYKKDTDASSVYPES